MQKVALPSFDLDRCHHGTLRARRQACAASIRLRTIGPVTRKTGVRAISVAGRTERPRTLPQLESAACAGMSGIRPPRLQMTLLRISGGTIFTPSGTSPSRHEERR